MKKKYGIKNNKVIELYPHKIKKDIGKHKYYILWKTTKNNLPGKTYHGVFYKSKGEALKKIDNRKNTRGKTLKRRTSRRRTLKRRTSRRRTLKRRTSRRRTSKKGYLLKDGDLKLKMSGGSSFLGKFKGIGDKLSSGVTHMKALRKVDKKLLSQLFKLILFIKILEFFKVRGPVLLSSIPVVQQATILVGPEINEKFTLFCDNAILELKNRYEGLLKKEDQEIPEVLRKYVEGKAEGIVQGLKDDVDEEVKEVREDGISENPEIEFEVGGESETYKIKIEKKK